METARSHLLQVATAAALRAGGIVKKGFMAPCQTSIKSTIHNLVTEYDKAAEEAIISDIFGVFPHHAFLAEESGGRVDNSTVLWIIDPLDGTLNFVHHIPIFAVSIAAYADEELQVGVVYLPMLDELFTAIKGEGAYLNGVRIHVSKTAFLKAALNSTGFPSDIHSNGFDHLRPLTNLIQLGAPIRDIGSAATNLAYLAAGRFDSYWVAELQPWDIAAGKLLIEEAGGMLSRYDGAPYDLFSTASLVATNGHLHQEFLKQLKTPLSF